MSQLTERAKITFYYQQLAQIKGLGHIHSLGWRTKERQEIRFKVLSKIGDLNNSHILDLGCGFGDLYSFLKTKFTNFKYTGIDNQKKFIEFAKEKYIDANNADFIHADFINLTIPETDYIIASGALSYLSDINNFYEKQISILFNSARKGFAFNMLDTAHFKKTPLLVSHDVSHIYEICSKITPKLTIRHDYMIDDFSVYLYK